MSRKTFYARFADKEAAFLATYDELADRVIAALVATGAAHRDAGARRSAQVARFLEILDRDRAVARVFMVDVLGAGPAALRRRAAVNLRFAEALFGDANVTAVRRDAVIGGVNQVVAARCSRRNRSSPRRSPTSSAPRSAETRSDSAR